MALVVLLAFVVLLTGLVLAYFTRSLASRKQSDSSLNDSRSRQLAQSALEVIVADLKQEIFNGSTTNTFGTETIYTPTNNFNAVPMRSGNPAYATNAADPVPNLTRRSVASDAIAFPGVSSRASAVSSTDPSLNGRFISRARWNKHYLIPRSDMGTNVDTTPNAAANFTPPDWVYVSSNGPEVLTAPSTAVIGRYAYAIYDEGGLLDMNVAGYVSNTPANAPHPAPAPSNLPTWGYANKGSLAFANLTVLPVTPALTQAQVDQIVGWRNYATARPAGNLGGLTFDATAALRYHDFVFSNTNGFLTVSGTATGGNTDQAFTSRQSLLQMRETLGFSQDALQYMGTFSRDLDQPSVSPSKDLPLVKSGINSNATTWGTGNDAFGKSRYDATKKSPYDINPEFPSVRVLQPFTRPDATTANAGDPLVNKRFPLSRLGLMLRTARASKSETDPIYRNFGLYRNSASDPWTYDHGDATGILRLSHPGTGGVSLGVVQSNREPDFFELLKACINIGSVGKSGCNSPAWDAPAGAMNNLQHNRDILSALQILQIGASIIDQYDGDGYPTRIVFAGSTDKEVRGIEDLPYIETIRNRLIFKTATVGNWLMQPVLWNPHDPNAPRPADYDDNSPKNFRVRVLTPDNDPIHADAFLLTDFSGTNKWGVYPLDYDAGLGTPLTFNSGEANGYYGFRQPTLLAEANTPALTNAQGNNVTQADADPGIQFIGLQIASNFPLKLPRKSDPALYDWMLKVSWGLHFNNSLGDIPGNPSSLPLAGIEFALECEDQDNPGYWITYNDFRFVPDGSGIGFFSTSVNTDAKARTWIQSNFAITARGLKAIDRPFRDPTNIFSNSPEVDPINPNNPASYQGFATRLKGGTRTDPRTSRWGTDIVQYPNLRPAVDRAQNIYETSRGGTGIGFGEHIGIGNASRPDKGFGPGGDYTNLNQTWSRGYQHGYFAENSTRDTRQAATENPARLKRYNRDPDGVIRRAMAGYSTDPANGGNFDKLEGLPMATNNFPSRPLILNRPFKSVSELGHVFRGSPWKNLDFSFPESGDAALLDVFCISEAPATDGIVAGRINLNSRQAPALGAVMAGANIDPANPSITLTDATAAEVAVKLVNRTTDTNAANRKGPLLSRVDLVGTWSPAAGMALATNLDPELYFSGFSSDIGTVPSLLGTAGSLIPRQRESVIRALSDVGTTRTWSLLIDVIAQSGRFGPAATALGQFMVEGEKRYWLHVAIDRTTGKVLDRQLEQVSE